MTNVHCYGIIDIEVKKHTYEKTKLEGEIMNFRYLNIDLIGRKKIKENWEKEFPKILVSNVETGLETLSETLSSVIERLDLVGTKWYLTDKTMARSRYSFLSFQLSKVFDAFFFNIKVPLRASILSLKEKKERGFDRTRVLKITGEDDENALCYIRFDTKTCEVPKKQSNSTGEGLEIASYEFFADKENLLNPSLEQLLDEINKKSITITNWITLFYYQQLDKIRNEIFLAIADENVDLVRSLSDLLCKNTEQFNEILNEVAKL